MYNNESELIFFIFIFLFLLKLFFPLIFRAISNFSPLPLSFFLSFWKNKFCFYIIFFCFNATDKSQSKVSSFLIWRHGDVVGGNAANGKENVCVCVEKEELQMDWKVGKVAWNEQWDGMKSKKVTPLLQNWAENKRNKNVFYAEKKEVGAEREKKNELVKKERLLERQKKQRNNKKRKQKRKVKRRMKERERKKCRRELKK